MVGNDRPYKVVKFATDITEQKVLDLDTASARTLNTDAPVKAQKRPEEPLAEILTSNTKYSILKTTAPHAGSRPENSQCTNHTVFLAETD